MIEGEGASGDAKAGINQVAVFDRSAGAIEIANPASEPLNLLLIAGEPIGEPVAGMAPS